MLRKTGIFLLTSAFALPGCFRSYDNPPTKIQSSTQCVESPLKQTGSPHGIPHTEYLFEGPIYRFGESGFDAPDHVEFYQIDSNRLNVLEINVGQGVGKRYTANEELN